MKDNKANDKKEWGAERGLTRMSSNTEKGWDCINV